MPKPLAPLVVSANACALGGADWNDGICAAEMVAGIGTLIATVGAAVGINVVGVTVGPCAFGSGVALDGIGVIGVGSKPRSVGCALGSSVTKVGVTSWVAASNVRVGTLVGAGVKVGCGEGVCPTAVRVR